MAFALRGSIAVGVVAIAGCNLLSGVDDLRFGDTTSTSTSTTGVGGAGGAGGSVVCPGLGGAPGAGGAGTGGGCTSDCLGGACVDGKCAPVPLSDVETNPFDLALGPQGVFWSSLRGSTQIRHCPLDGCPDPGGAGGAGGGGGGSSGPGPSAVLTMGGDPQALGWGDDGRLYWTRRTSGGAIVSYAFSGPPTGVITVVGLGLAGDPASLTQGAGFVYWADEAGGSVRRCPTSGCTTAEILASDGASVPHQVALDGDWLYWTDAAGTIRRCQVAACEEEILSTDQVEPRGLALYGGAVYWTDVAAGTVMRCSDMACACPPIPLATQQDEPYDLAVDATGAYWVNEGTGALMHCRLPGCPGGPEVLATSLPGIGRIALGSDAIYWAQNAANQVVRLAKP